MTWKARALILVAVFLVASSVLAVVRRLGSDSAAGSFTTNDPLLNKIWAASVKTAHDAVVPGPLTHDALGRTCAIDLSTVIVDGPVRDRCPWMGDQAVIGRTLDVSTPRWDVQKRMLEWYAANQHPGGEIPASPLVGGSLVLVDYNAYWVQALHDYVLASGDVALARRLWPQLVVLMDVYYPAHTHDGLFSNDAGASDYAVHRAGPLVAYYNAQYAFALGHAAELAGWVGDSNRSARWETRRATLAQPFRAAFWDGPTGAFRDTTADPKTHPQDAQAFAILAGLATARQAASALAYIDHHHRRSYGNTVTDSDTWNSASVGYDVQDRVYPFISYFEVLARYAAHQPDSALELIRREWGYMVTNAPHSTMWEIIGPFGGGPSNNTRPSYDAGWSSGAAPALTEYVLGVQATSPGYATFTVTPHQSDLSWARGTVVTPHGLVKVSWKRRARGLPRITVTAPPGTRWTNPPSE